MKSLNTNFVTTELTDIPKLDTPNLIGYALETKKELIEGFIRGFEDKGFRVSYQIIPFEINAFEDSCQLFIMFSYWK